MIKDVETLRSQCEKSLTDQKVLLVPSFAYGSQLAAEAAQRGTPVLNLHVQTPLLLASDVIDRFSGHPKRDFVSDAEALFLLEKICSEVLDDSSYFGGLRDQEGFWRRLRVRFASLIRRRLASCLPACSRMDGKSRTSSLQANGRTNRCCQPTCRFSVKVSRALPSFSGLSHTVCASSRFLTARPFHRSGCFLFASSRTDFLALRIAADSPR